MTRLLVPVFLASVAAVRAQDATAAPTARLYDLRDLVQAAAMPAEPAARSAPTAATPADRGQGTAGAIAGLVRAFVVPALPRPEDVSVVGAGYLAMVGTEAQHAWLDGLLRRGREDTERIVRVHAQFLSIPLVTFAERVQPTFARAAPGGGEEAGTVVLAPTPETEMFLTRLPSLPGVETVQAIELGAHLLQPSDMFAGEQIAYVRDHELKVVPGADGKPAAMVADPVVDVVEAGARLRCVAALLEQGQLGVDIECSLSEVSTPMPSVAVTIPGTTTPATVQLPRQRVARAHGALDLASGQVALLTLPGLGAKRCVVVVRAALVTPPGTTAADAAAKTWTYDVGDLIEGGQDALIGLGKLVRARIQPPLTNEGIVLEGEPHYLLLRGSREQQAWLVAFLRDLRSAPATTWSVEASLVKVPRAEYAQRIASLLPVGNDAGCALSAAQVEHLQQALAAAGVSPDASTLVALPRFVRTRVKAFLHAVPYVRDYEVKHVDGKEVARPVRDEVEEGVGLTLLAATLADGGLGLLAEMEPRDLQRPMPRFVTTLGVGETKVAVDLPRVTVRPARVTVDLANGATAVLVPPMTGPLQPLLLLRVEGAAGRVVR
ncbi:MAG: hypothetical protein R3F56_18970 [Planctomycetota bacterium]